MSSDWSSMLLGDFIELKRGYDLPKKHRVLGKVPLISSAGLSDHHSEAKVTGPGVVTGRYGTIGEVYYVESDFWPLNTTLYIRDFKGNDPKFVYYFLKTIDYLKYSDKAAVPGVNRNHLHMASVFVPTLVREQQEIASILSALDDKIKVNQDINQTLEQMAQAIFKSWFVDFEPVKAKIAVLEAGGSEEDALLAAMQAISAKDEIELARLQAEQPEQYAELRATAELFPSAMQDSELGEIPVGWKAGMLSDIAGLSNCRVSTDELTLETYVSTENMLENKKGIVTAVSLPSSASVPSFEPGEILISNIRPYFKKIWLATFEGGRSPDVLGFRSRHPGTSEYLFNFLYRDEFFGYMMLTSKGAKMPRGDKEAIMQYADVIPPVDPMSSS